MWNADRTSVVWACRSLVTSPSTSSGYGRTEKLQIIIIINHITDETDERLIKGNVINNLYPSLERVTGQIGSIRGFELILIIQQDDEFFNSYDIKFGI